MRDLGLRTDNFPRAIVNVTLFRWSQWFRCSLITNCTPCGPASPVFDLQMGSYAIHLILLLLLVDNFCNLCSGRSDIESMKRTSLNTTGGEEEDTITYPVSIPASRVYKALFQVQKQFNTTACGPPALPPGERLNCDSKTAFTGKRLAKRRKVAHFFLFAFEVDVLDIMFHEEWDVVDVFFLVESIFAHKKGVSKPLIWERLKTDPRFAWTLSKVVHIVLDHPRMVESLQLESNWGRESGATKAAMHAVFEWNQHAPPAERLTDDDIFISGNVDEVLSRENLYKLSWCEWKTEVISGALWMPLGALDRAFRTDWPADRSLPFTFAMPTLYRFGSTSEVSGRSFGLPKAYIMGGMHLTNYALPVVNLLKDLTCTECDGSLLGSTVKISTSPDLMQARHYAMESVPGSNWARRMVPVESLSKKEKEAVYVPWYLRCHPELFPAWYGELDPRNSILIHRPTKKRLRSRNGNTKV